MKRKPVLWVVEWEQKIGGTWFPLNNSFDSRESARANAYGLRLNGPEFRRVRVRAYVPREGR